jgi:hypothetical protein
MTKATPKTRVSKYFSLARDQATLDFVDVPIGNDVTVFLDPSRIRSMETAWSTECSSLLQHFFERLLEHIRTGDTAAGLRMLEGLSERNEFHLGFSRGRSKGSGIGREFAKDFWDALTNSKAGKSGLLRDIEDACLFIDGVGPDRISDATCNILRGPLIQYTRDMCAYYGIPLQQGVESGPIWNPLHDRWEDSLISLPITPFGKILLVPKIAVRHRLVYDSHGYYRGYLLPSMQIHEKSINSSLVHELKDGRTRVTKKSLMEKYGADKLAIATQTLEHPGVLEKYRKDTKRTSRPLTHEKLAEIENIDPPRFDELLKAVTTLPSGKDSATAYENSIEALLSALFFPSLSASIKQHEIHEGRKRIDITYINSAQTGFFYWLASHYSSAHIFVECKNYGKEVGNPEVDQLAGRFGPSRGQVGVLICRSIENDKLLEKRCTDTAKDHRGFIIHLTDSDLATLVADYTKSNGGSEYSLLRKKFTKLVA